ncbi:MAG: helix-turn-helix domain-containing protein [Thermoproteota archaeon]
MVCKRCFTSSSKMRENRIASAGSVMPVRKLKSRVLTKTAKAEDKLEPIPDLGKTIMERRKYLGLSVQELGVKVGIRESLIKKVESEKITLPIQELRRLERVLGISLVRVSEDEKFYKVDSKKSSNREDKGLTLGDLLKGG